jgi:hypothetical protein
MRDLDQEQPTIKQYLLGHLERDRQWQFEEQFVTDAEFRELVLMIEEELIDDYLAGLLPADEKADFDNHYLSGPRQLQELTLAKALREYAMESAATAPATDAKESRHWILNLLFGRRWKPTLVIASLLLVTGVISWTWIKRWHWGGQQPTLNSEISLLNKTPYSAEPTFSVTLTNFLTRSPRQEQKFSIPSGINIIQLQLQIPPLQYQSYQATLQLNDGPEVFTVGDLKAEETGEGRFINLRLPARIFSPGDYILSISGLNTNRRPESVADYFFRVVK